MDTVAIKRSARRWTSAASTLSPIACGPIPHPWEVPMTLSGGVWQTGNAHATGVTFGTWIPPASVAYLAIMSAAGPVCRDVLLALFWPDRNDEEARRALRQALYHLRRAVGDDVIVGAGDELSKDGLRKRSSFYRGDFFDGFHVEEVTSELDEWIDRTRTRLKRRA